MSAFDERRKLSGAMVRVWTLNGKKRTNNEMTRCVEGRLSDHDDAVM